MSGQTVVVRVVSGIRSWLSRSGAPFGLWLRAITTALRRTRRDDWIHVQTTVRNAQHLWFEYWYWCGTRSGRRRRGRTRIDLRSLICRCNCMLSHCKLKIKCLRRTSIRIVPLICRLQYWLRVRLVIGRRSDHIWRVWVWTIRWIIYRIVRVVRRVRHHRVRVLGLRKTRALLLWEVMIVTAMIF